MAMSKAEKLQMEGLSTVAEMRLNENKKLLTAIKKTIKENLHLADGENCTFIHLKKALEKIKSKPVKAKKSVK